MIAWRLCAEHGVLDASTLTCPTCGVATIDATDPKQQDMVAAAFTRPPSMRRVWIIWAVILAMAAVGIYIWTKSEHVGSLAAHAIAVLAVAVIVVGSRPPRAWRVPIDPAWRARRWTSATMIAMGLCLAFVVIRELVGVQALWYGAGLPVWRIATATLTHAGFMHLLGNMLFTWAFGMMIDLRVGRALTAVIIAASAVGAAVAQARYSANPGIGFSGAVYGLLGATLALMPTSPRVIPIKAAAIVVPTWAYMIVIVPAYTLVAAFDRHSNVAWMAHLGGFVAGFVVALPMRRVQPSKLYLLLEQRRRDATTHIASYETVTLTTDVEPEAVADVRTSQDAEIAVFHAAARRRRAIVSTVGGVALLVFGGTATVLATIMKADSMAAGRRAQVIIIGLIMCLAGGFMLVQVVKEARARRKPH